MNKKHPIWLRAVEGTETGGSAGSADSTKGSSEDSEKDHEADSESSDDTPDWKALYETSQQEVEKWKSHSRKWEERAKAKNDNDGDTSDIRARLAEVEQNLKEARAENERVETERLKFELGAEFGLSKDDVDLLRGTEDDMRALAKRLGEKTKQRYPENPYQGRGSQGSARQNAESWYEELIGKNT